MHSYQIGNQNCLQLQTKISENLVGGILSLTPLVLCNLLSTSIFQLGFHLLNSSKDFENPISERRTKKKQKKNNNNKKRNIRTKAYTEKENKEITITSKGPLPDLDPKIHLAFGPRNRSHRRGLGFRCNPIDAVTFDSNPDLLSLQPSQLHLHFGVHLNLHGDPALPLQIRPQRRHGVRVQISRLPQNCSESRLVLRVAEESRDCAIGDFYRGGGQAGKGKWVVEEGDVGVGILREKSDVEEGGEVGGGRVGRGGDVERGNAEGRNRELGPLRVVEGVKNSAGDAHEKGQQEE